MAGDKSISHRAVILGAIAEGTTRIRGLLMGGDVMATVAAFRQMGVMISSAHDDRDRVFTVEGVGLHGLREPDADLDLGNSGTAFRLLAGLLSAQSFPCVLKGDASLSARPMSRIIAPLTDMGASIVSESGKPPLEISPVNRLSGIIYHAPVASAQVKSSILLAGLYAEGKVSVIERGWTRDHTERMLSGFGYAVKWSRGLAQLRGGGRLTGQDIDIPADLSSAAFFIVATLITEGSEVVLEKVGINPSRSGILDVVRRMGGRIETENAGEAGGEPVADIRVMHSELTGCNLDGEDVILAIDEIPAIAVAAACAHGETVIRGASELRVKESDRIAAVVEGLRVLGIQAREFPDGMRIVGGKFQSGTVNSFGDHRIAMAFSLAGLVAEGPVDVVDCANVSTSFPEFPVLGKSCGMNITVHDE